jgi:hypothetical protein
MPARPEKKRKVNERDEAGSMTTMALALMPGVYIASM